jgi:hypothetical protein
MRRYLSSLVILLSSESLLAAEVGVELTPFEPPLSASFDWKDKFAHPKELEAPKYVYPEEMRRAGIAGEAVALVVLKLDGTPERISILYDTMERSADYPGVYFSTAVIEGLKKARWVPPKKAPVWFYVKTTFELIEEGDRPPPAKPGVVVGVMSSVPSVFKGGERPNQSIQPIPTGRSG